MANTKVYGEQIVDGSITAAKLADGTIVAAELAANAVETAAINADAVTGAKIADNAIDSEHYVDGSIDTAHIAASQITLAKMAANSIDSDQYVDGSIDTAHIATAQVTTAKIADGNISTAKLADLSVTSGKLATNLDLAGTLDVTGATVLDSTLAVAGATTILTNLSSDTTSTPDTVLTLSTKYASTGSNGAAGAGSRLEFKIPDDETNPITGAAIAGIKEAADDSDASAGMAFYVSQNDTTLDEAVRIDHDGKVGIGTTSPSQLLHLGGATNKGVQITSSTSNAGYLGVYQDQTIISVNRDPTDGSFVDTSKTAQFIDLQSAAGGGWIKFATTATNNAEPTERMRIDASGFVGINTAGAASYTPLTLETASGSAYAAGGVNGVGLLLRNRSSTVGTSSGIKWAANSSYHDLGGIHMVLTGNSNTNETADLTFFTSNSGDSGNTEKMRIDSAGNVGIGTTSPRTLLHASASAQNQTQIGNCRQFSLTDSAGYDATRVEMGMGYWHPTHTYQPVVLGAIITDDGGQPVSDFYIATKSSTDGDDAPIERFRITKDGKTGIGTASPSAGLMIQTSTNGTGLSGDDTNVAYFQNQEATAGRNYGVRVKAGTNATDYALRVDTASTTGVFEVDGTGDIICNGVVRIGATSQVGYNDEGMLQVKGKSAHTAMKVGNTSNGQRLLHFFNAAEGEVGHITGTASATSYNTSSDYRLKENVDYTWDATTRLKQLKPARFNWIADETNTLLDGFLAHEVSSIVPEAITGAKDGTPMQAIDQAKLVPLLVKTIQELEARIATLEG